MMIVTTWSHVFMTHKSSPRPSWWLFFLLSLALAFDLADFMALQLGKRSISPVLSAFAGVLAAVGPGAPFKRYTYIQHIVNIIELHSSYLFSKRIFTREGNLNLVPANSFR